MPRGACVIRRQGKRGVVFYVKYVDAAGRQVKERAGSKRTDGPRGRHEPSWKPA